MGDFPNETLLKFFSEQLLSMRELDSTEGSSNRKDSEYFAQAFNVAGKDLEDRNTGWGMYVRVWTKKALHAKIAS